MEIFILVLNFPVNLKLLWTIKSINFLKRENDKEFSKTDKDMNPQIQEAQQTPSRINKMNYAPRHTKGKLQKT